MPYKEGKAALTDIGTEELGHLEIVAAIIHQLTRNLTMEEIEASGFGPYYIDHTTGIWPQASGGVPFNACEFQSKGDPITDLFEDMAAEQKARSTYDNILRIVKDPEVCDPIRYLREREIVHFQRFGEANIAKLSRFCVKKPSGFPLHNMFIINKASSVCTANRLALFFRSIYCIMRISRRVINVIHLCENGENRNGNRL